ncbi:adenylate/guanylate cyclase domain-containing protein [Thalassoglobus sp.]|uniref:adenylate/guanylate cyclase domain-containing protein n=1 Tax=Thalassoglobus sp. TaxID=2795869 RepID=UPI003AA863A6
MYYLNIQSLKTPDSLRIKLKELQTLRLGRSTKAALSVPWDPAISREHADLTLTGKELKLVCLQAARNPAVFNGKIAPHLILQVGESFRIGSTSFKLEVEEVTQTVQGALTGSCQIDIGNGLIQFDAMDETGSADLLEQHSYSPGELSNFSFGDADDRIEMLSKLPQLISQSESDEQLAYSLASLLLKAVPKATAVAVAQFPVDKLPNEYEVESAFPPPLMLRIDTRHSFDGIFRPSRRLILRALRNQQSVMQIWHAGVSSANFTLTEGLGWAIVTPITGKSCEGWCLYISGAGSDGAMVVTQKSLLGEVRCAELIAQFIGSVRQVRLLENQKTRMGAFFSPRVLESLNNATSANALSPVERNIAVLFCDVRNFSIMAERLEDDLLSLLNNVSEALGTMTDGILDFDGTIADFQGDAALGFWGWPVRNPDSPLLACLAAIRIFEGFEKASQQADSPDQKFSIGMGIASGRALAGQIGTTRQSKLGVFGPVVNAGSRLQGLSKKFGVPICIDEATAQAIKGRIPCSVAVTRRLGNVIPLGMTSPMNLYSLEPVIQNQPAQVNEFICQTFEYAVDAVQSGEWNQANKILDTLPETDGPTIFLKQFVSEQQATPSKHWSGTIEFDTK